MVIVLGTAVTVPVPYVYPYVPLAGLQAPRKAYRHLFRIGKLDSVGAGTEHAAFKYATQPAPCGVQGFLENVCQQVFISVCNCLFFGTLWACKRGIAEPIVISPDDLHMIPRTHTVDELTVCLFGFFF